MDFGNLELSTITVIMSSAANVKSVMTTTKSKLNGNAEYKHSFTFKL